MLLLFMKSSSQTQNTTYVEMDESRFSQPTSFAGATTLEERLLVNEESQTIDGRQTLSWTLYYRLCALGFLIHFQPSEAYLSSYLEETKGFTIDDLNNRVWPFDTYGALLSLLPIGLCAEHFGFRTVIFFGLIMRESTRLLLLYGTELWQMSLMQLTYATAMSVDWVYTAYIYMVITDSKYYQSATSYVRAATLLGQLLSSMSAQVLVSYTQWSTDYTSLFYISWISTSMALLAFFMLPPPQRSSPVSIFKVIKVDGFKSMLHHIGNLYGEPSGSVMVWSIWWIGGFASYSIYGNYYQNQFIEYHTSGGDAYFGFVNGALEMTSVIGAMIPVYVICRHKEASRLWIECSLEIIGISSLAMIGCLSVSVFWRNLYVSYICNCLVFGIYSFQMASACSSIAHSMDGLKEKGHHYYAMTFTINCFFGLVCASVTQSVGAVMRWTTNMYYLSCVLFYLLVLLAMLSVKCQRMK